MKNANAKEKSTYQRLFEMFGMSFSVNGSKNATAEECPFCGGNRFYLNIETGEYKCHKGACNEKGNAYTFINHVHADCLSRTADKDLRALRDKRGLPLQTLKRHGIAWDDRNRCWLIPYRSEDGKVQNLTRYYLPSGKKLVLPALPLRLYGRDQLSKETGRLLFVCEGPFDAIALDHHLRDKKTRARYDILAVPSASVFRAEWLPYLQGRQVRLLFDNDKAGQDGQDHIAKLVRDGKVDCRLSGLRWPSGVPDGCDVSDLARDGVNLVEFSQEHCTKLAERECQLTFKWGNEIEEDKMEWMDARYIPFGSFVSFSGLRGTHKSGIVRDIVARATAGLPMPGSGEALPPFKVLYFTSEDSDKRVKSSVALHGGDVSRLAVYDITSDAEPVDLLNLLEEMEAQINTHQVRLVVLDALNSFVGGDISTDSRARRTLSGRLQWLARKTGACIIGIRNWGRQEGGTASQKALGATSLSDVSRCAMNTHELEPVGKIRRFQLEFERVSDTAPPKPLPYWVKDLSTCNEDSHLRRIVWGRIADPKKLKASLKRVRKKVAQKGSSSRYTHYATAATKRKDKA